MIRAAVVLYVLVSLAGVVTLFVIALGFPGAEHAGWKRWAVPAVGGLLAVSQIAFLLRAVRNRRVGTDAP